MNRNMMNLIILSLEVWLCSCTTSEMSTLRNDLKTKEVTLFSYEVGGFETYHCDPVVGQKALKAWSNTLKKQELIASWPDPDNYLILSFKKGRNYRIRTYIGQDTLNFSVLYADGIIYTGEQLMLESVCPELKAHNQDARLDR